MKDETPRNNTTHEALTDWLKLVGPPLTRTEIFDLDRLAKALGFTKEDAREDIHD